VEFVKEVSYHYFFAVYIDDLIIDIVRQSGGCTFHFVSVCIVVYADDIILLAPSVAVIQRLVSLYEENLLSLELAINIKKSVCTRIGSRFNASCLVGWLFNGISTQKSQFVPTEEEGNWLSRLRMANEHCTLRYTITM